MNLPTKKEVLLCPQILIYCTGTSVLSGDIVTISEFMISSMLLSKVTDVVLSSKIYF